MAVRGMAVVMAVAVAAVTFAPGPAAANVLEVQGVSVDITAESAAAAREQAIVEAQRKAFLRLADELTGGAPAPKASDDAIARLVRDFSIVSEKSSAVRYIATFDFRFDEGGVRSLLTRSDAPVIARADPVVVVPVYEDGAVQALWDDPNPWRQAWAARPSTGGLVPLVVPPGDLGDVAIIGPEQAAAGDPSSLTELARHYGVGGALVARAVLEESAPDQAAVTVDVTRYERGVPSEQFTKTLRANPGEPVAALLGRAAAAVGDEVQARWRQQRDPGGGPGGTIAVTAAVNGLSDWLAMRGRLQSHPMVGAADLVALSPNQVRLNLRYRGEIDALAAALSRDGLDLSRDGAGWVLRPAAAGQPVYR